MTDPLPTQDGQQLFQTFRARGKLVRIPVVPSLTEGLDYVIWSDIQDCFPNVLRIQNGNLYVALLRGNNLCRVRPHGIKYHPGVILDVIFKDYNDPPAASRKTTARISATADSTRWSVPTSTTTSTTTPPPPPPPSTLINGYSNQNSTMTTPVRSKRPEPPRPHLQHQPQQQSVQQSTFNSDNSSDISDALDSDDAFLDVIARSLSASLALEASSHAFASTSPTTSSSAAQAPSRQQQQQQRMISPANENIQESKDASVIQIKSDKVEQHQQPTKVSTAVGSKNPATTGERTRMDNNDRSKAERLVAEAEKFLASDKILKPAAAQALMTAANNVIAESNSSSSSSSSSSSVSGGNPHQGEVTKNSMVVAASKIVAKLTQAQANTNTNNTNTKVVAVSTDKPWIKEAKESITWLSSALSTHPPPGQPLTFDHDDELFLEIIGNRIRDIVDRRYRWAEGLTPKFFIPVFLGQKPGTDTKVHIKNFGIQFCCDCGEIPDKTLDANNNIWHPHWVPGSHGHPIKAKHMLDLILIYGEYMMVCLEMLLWGAYLGENRRILAYNRDGRFLQHLNLSMDLLKNYGVLTSREILDKTQHMTRRERAAATTRIKPLEGTQDFNQLLRFMGTSRPCMSDLHTFVTADRDSRWICKSHLYTLSPNAALPDDADPPKPVPLPVNPPVIKTAQLAKEFYRSVPTLETYATRFRLDWDLSGEDFAELAEAVSKCTSVAVTVDIRCLNRHETPIAGFEKGDLGQILIAALQNKHIEVFSFGGFDVKYPQIQNEDDFAITDLYDLGSIARFARDVRSGRIKLHAQVLSVDMAVSYLRRAVKGFHHLSSLELEILTLLDKVRVDFAEPEEVLKVKGLVEDTEYLTEGKLVNFFAKRGFVDKVRYVSQDYGDNLFLDSMMLTEVSITFTLVRDRDLVRKIIKDNKKLRKLTLENTPSDDPSQIFETFKSLVINHPNFMSLVISQQHEGRGRTSEFVWRHVRDPKRMEVDIEAFTNDKIGSMLQKYASSITELKFLGITETDANILERSFRPKKGPFKLRRFVLSDLHITEPNAIELLQKVVMRSEAEEIWIVSEVPLKNTATNGIGRDNKNKNHKASHIHSAQVQRQIPCVVYSDFITAVRSRLTNLQMWGKGTHKLLMLLSERPEAVEMPLLTHVGISEDPELKAVNAILTYEWIMNLIMFKTPLDMPMVTRNGHLFVDTDGRILHIDTPAADLPVSPSSPSLSDKSDGKELVPSTAEPPRGRVLERPIRYQYEIFGIQPLKSLIFRGVFIREADWNILLQLVDWTQLREFRVNQRNPLPSLALRLMLSHIQVEGGDLGTQLRTFSVEGDGKMGPKAEEIAACMEELQYRFTHPVRGNAVAGHEDKAKNRKGMNERSEEEEDDDELEGRRSRTERCNYYTEEAQKWESFLISINGYRP